MIDEIEICKLGLKLDFMAHGKMKSFSKFGPSTVKRIHYSINFICSWAKSNLSLSNFSFFSDDFVRKLKMLKNNYIQAQ
jgi:hypothetical protein